MMMIEARRTERVRSFLRARIIFNNRTATIDCVVKNLSKGGAKIELSNALSIPESFELEIPQKGRSYNARLSWRDKDSIGVSFVEEKRDALEDPVRQVERLERENRALRASVVKLTARLEELGQNG